MKKIILLVILTMSFNLLLYSRSYGWGKYPGDCRDCECAKSFYYKTIKYLIESRNEYQRALDHMNRIGVDSAYFSWHYGGSTLTRKAAIRKIMKLEKSLSRMQRGLNWASRGCP